ncbi:Flp family type IVb pilin [Fontimonas sp. SYSU GA230001]|uniref:Flp family type IVb pilin n=1 Tax=Fontimonas sp. SYSU GA230001 TaxID=3142450 RepID=UPI0032B416DF
MLTILRSYLDFYRDTRGLTTVEYAVAGGLIAAAVIAAFILLGQNVDTEIRGIAGQIG